jgi:hypothetical protein
MYRSDSRKIPDGKSCVERVLAMIHTHGDGVIKSGWRNIMTNIRKPVLLIGNNIVGDASRATIQRFNRFASREVDE